VLVIFLTTLTDTNGTLFVFVSPVQIVA
jgi:hypothetical protein